MSKSGLTIFMCIGALLGGSVVMTFFPDPIGVTTPTSIYAQSNKVNKIAEEQNISLSVNGPSTVTRQRLVVIDPGHAGPVTHNGEAVGTASKYDKNSDTGVYWTEYELTLETSKLVESKLTSMGYKVMMTRTENSKKGDDPNKVLSLTDRWSMAVDNNADAFLSIHYDGLDDSSYKGFHVIYGKDSDLDYAETMRDAYKAKNPSISVNSAGAIDNGLSFRPDDLAVLRPSQQTRPAVLVEVGTLTNQSDSKYLTDKSNWDNVAQGLVDGVDKYLGGPTETIQVGGTQSSGGYSTKEDDGLTYGPWTDIPQKWQSGQSYTATEYTGVGFGVGPSPGCWWSHKPYGYRAGKLWRWAREQGMYKRVNDHLDVITYNGNDYVCVAVGYRIAMAIPEGQKVGAIDTNTYSQSVGKTLHIKFDDGSYGWGIIVDTKNTSDSTQQACDYWGHLSGSLNVLETYISPGNDYVYSSSHTRSFVGNTSSYNYVAIKGIGDAVAANADHPWHGKNVVSVQVGPDILGDNDGADVNEVHY